MTIEKIRRENLNGLIAEHGSIKALGEAARVSDNLLSQYRNSKSMGNGFARKLERGLSRPEGWLDQPQYAIPGLGDDHDEAVRIIRALPTKAMRREWLELGRKLGERRTKH